MSETVPGVEAYAEVVAHTVSESVMASQSAHDVVIPARSAGEHSPADDHASITHQSQATGNTEKTNPLSKTPFDVDHSQSSHPDTVASHSINGVPSDRGDETITRSFEENKNLEPASNNSDSRAATPSVHGEKLEAPYAEDTATISNSVDASGGSDTESRQDKDQANARGDSSDKGHIRSNSVKRPASFKAVSVTKSFLAKASAGSSQPAKPASDKASVGSSMNGQPPAPSSTSALRPRLVAKSGTGRDSGLRGATSATNSGRSSAPDPSQVWNKNRPAQPPAPKQFTDEELKQHYGIHLATRLQADESSKEAKWADIDEEDDDWAPDTIEWNDGTKVTLATPEEPANASQPVQPAITVKPDPPVAEKPKSPAPQPPPAESAMPSSPAKPIAVVATSAQPKAVGLVLKGAPEKPTLVAKPPAPVPVKSPWATLPPVEKVPPVAIKPPPPPQAGDRFQRDPHGFESLPPMPSSTKEIAADDFNRSWRDHHPPGGNRELFNSQSGRYEPVNDRRRSSTRGEQVFRQPSVLQRPSQGEQSGPAEPSAAFQTNRSGGPDIPWGRRRASSNVSGGSGHLARRASIGRGQDLQSYQIDASPRGRQRSHQGHLPEMPDPRSSPSRIYAVHRADAVPGLDQPPQLIDSQQQGTGRPPLQMENTPADGAAVSQAPPIQAEQYQPPIEDPIAMQKKIMRESRELALKRRREQEEREEAERKERIRKKMETLGLPPPTEKKENSMDATQAPNVPPAADGKEVPQMASSKDNAHPGQSVPKPPVPESSDDVKHYGVMKVHHPVSLRRQLSNRRQVLKHLAGANLVDGSHAPPSAETSEPDTTTRTPNVTAIIPSNPTDSGPPPSQQERLPSPDKGREHLGGSSTADTEGRKNYWGSATAGARSPQKSRLWGLTKSEALADSSALKPDFSELRSGQQSSVQLHHTSTRTPGPIGPPSATQPLSDIANNTRPSNSLDAGRTQLSAQQSPLPRTGFRLTHPVEQAMGGQHRIGTGIVPLSAAAASTSALQASSLAEKNAISAWKSLPTQLEANDAATAINVLKERKERSEDPAPTPLTFHDTWRQVVVDPSQPNSRRKFTSVTDVFHGAGKSEVFDSGARPTPRGTGTATSGMSRSTASPANNGRESRFFPHAAQPSAVLEPRVSSDTTDSGVDLEFDPCPPPESISTNHPAYDGDPKHIHVSLPTPKPIVRLPPKVGQMGPPAVIVPPPATTTTDVSRSPPPRPTTEPVPSWQDKINGLFGRKTSVSSNKSHTPTVSPASKAPLEVASVAHPATVSLPAQTVVAATGNERHEDKRPGKNHAVESFATRVTDDVLFEEREFGSLPTVKLPPGPPASASAWQSVKAQTGAKARIKFPKPVLATSREPFLLDDIRNTPGGPAVAIEVRLPGSFRRISIPFMARTLALASSGPKARAPLIGGTWKDKRRSHKPRDQSLSEAAVPTTATATRPPMPAHPATGAGGGARAASLGSATWASRVASGI